LVLALALIAAACGGDSDDTTTTAAAADTTTTAAAADTTTTAAAAETTTTAAEMTEIKVDFGVDLDAKTIKIGQLADITNFAAFAALVNPIMDGQKMYWDYVNANGGIGDGFMVEMVTRDTAYDLQQHIAAYDEIRDEVVAISHGTGSDPNLAIAEDLAEDHMILVPATWYSGWTDTNIAPGIVHTGVPYCLESMSLLDWLKDEEAKEGNDAPTLAVASLPGDFGLDSVAGALKWAEINGITVVYDGKGKIIPGQDNAPIGVEIAASGADLVLVTTTPSTFGEVYGAAFQQGFEAKWTGAGPTYNPAFIGPDSPIAAPIQRDWYGGFYSKPWGSESVGMALIHQLYEESGSTEVLKDYVTLGVIEAMIVEAALRQAYANGDMTREGVFNALYSFDDMDFLGAAPNERYTGSTADQVQRSTTLYRPSQEDLLAGGSGAVIVQEDFVGPTAEAFDFTEACYKIDG
ncbi:MAG: ABC transporter substrate-binding protein, partial [Actinomycetota bacterium]|nr:ABC transporter substrate-binding protein [Actinomycetota bacterium]